MLAPFSAPSRGIAILILPGGTSHIREKPDGD
jgi:hypothetical protein